MLQSVCVSAGSIFIFQPADYSLQAAAMALYTDTKPAASSVVNIVCINCLVLYQWHYIKFGI
jgi:hypothetical protein